MRQSLIQLAIGSKLRNRFILFFIVLSVVPVLALAGITLSLIDLSHRQDVSRLEIQLINQKIEEIEKFFADTLGILELRVGFSQRSPLKLEQQEFILEGILEENPSFREISFIDVGGLIANDIPTVAGIETAKIARSPHAAKLQLQDVSLLSKFIVPSQGKNFIGDAYYTLSGPMVTLSAPVRNKNNDIIHILAAEVNLSQVIRSIEVSHLGTSGYLVLIDKSGSLMAYRGKEDIRAGTDLYTHERVKKVLEGGTLDALGEHDRYTTFFGGEAVVGAGKKIPKIGWGILAEWPISDADSVIRDIKNEVTLLVLFSIFAMLILAPLFAERLVRPIRQLEEGAREIEKGNFEQQVKITTKDELEELGNAFNGMAKGLKRLKELQEEFVFIAAHDLRAPVTVIKGYLSMIFEGDAGPLSKKMRGYLDETQIANLRLVKLVEDLLEVARSEAGRIVIEVKPIDIRESIGQTIRELKPLANKKSITLEYDMPPDLTHVLADSERVVEVMANLVSNAIKYTPEGGEVQVFHKTKGREVITHVKDNGLGIAKEAQKKIFEKFYRVKSKETQEIGGTGLGLFIVKQLVEKMNGKIWFQSVKGKGSTFSFSLSSTSHATKNPPSAYPPTGGRGGGKKPVS